MMKINLTAQLKKGNNETDKKKSDSSGNFIVGYKAILKKKEITDENVPKVR